MRSTSPRAIRARPGTRALVAGIVAYALSPIDLIPDFIPVLGLLDDVILLPLGIVVALRLIPAEVMAESRLRAAEAAARPVSRGVTVVIVLIWIGALAATAWLAYRCLGRLQRRLNFLPATVIGLTFAQPLPGAKLETSPGGLPW